MILIFHDQKICSCNNRYFFDCYCVTASYYHQKQYLELLAMLNTEQSVLFKKLQDNRSDIIGLERDASFRCGLCVGLKLGSLSSLLL